MTTKYFKTDSKTVIDSWNTYINKKSFMRDQCIAFANDYGAEPVIVVSGNETKLSGISFENPRAMNEKEFWTKATGGNHYAQVPRRSIAGKENKKRLAEIQEKYKAGEPEKVTSDDFFLSLGISWGDLFFTGFNGFLQGGFYYAATGRLMENMTEILGSEFAAAKNANDSF